MMTELKHTFNHTQIIIHGYHHRSFDQGDCDVYIKGILTIAGYAHWEQRIHQMAEQHRGSVEGFEESLCGSLRNSYGLFSQLIRLGSDFFIISDIIRSIPVFYGFVDGDLRISDDLSDFGHQMGMFTTDNDKLEELVAAGFVFGNRTVYQNIYALRAGEIVSVINSKPVSKRYFVFKPAEVPGSFKDISDFTHQFDVVLSSVFLRMIDQTPGIGRWVIPLSGGHDSRIIVNTLHKLGVKNVICYSYGLSGNEQSGLSKQVSGALGYEWYFVEYTAHKWKSLYETGMMDEYIQYAFNGISTPHFQDFLAVYELKKNNILKKDDVIVPGHTFDFLVGSNLSLSDNHCESKLAALKRTGAMFIKNGDFSKAPFKSLEEVYDDAALQPRHFPEYFNWQEQRSKFLVNAVRGYEFFGFDYRLPFWDKELVDFWLKVPSPDRMGRKVFFESEKQGILVDRIMSIPFFGKNDRVSVSLPEQILRNILPAQIKTAILRLTHRKVQYNAGLNQIYELRASSVREILDPVEDFPLQTREYFAGFLDRFPHQIDYHFLTTLYTIRKCLDEMKKSQLPGMN